MRQHGIQQLANGAIKMAPGSNLRDLIEGLRPRTAVFETATAIDRSLPG
jgi:hypothetical protein